MQRAADMFFCFKFFSYFTIFSFFLYSYIFTKDPNSTGDQMNEQEKEKALKAGA